MEFLLIGIQRNEHRQRRFLIRIAANPRNRNPSIFRVFFSIKRYAEVGSNREKLGFSREEEVERIFQRVPF